MLRGLPDNANRSRSHGVGDKRAASSRNAAEDRNGVRGKEDEESQSEGRSKRRKGGDGEVIPAARIPVMETEEGEIVDDE